jgi:hypothetical protein
MRQANPQMTSGRFARSSALAKVVGHSWLPAIAAALAFTGCSSPDNTTTGDDSEEGGASHPGSSSGTGSSSGNPSDSSGSSSGAGATSSSGTTGSSSSSGSGSGSSSGGSASGSTSSSSGASSGGGDSGVDAGKTLDAGLDAGGKTPDAGAGVDSGSSGTPDAGAVTGPCDIYAASATPCVAAHSTVRALYGAYDGNLYQVKRASDGTTKNIGVLSPGGFASSATQDSFCTGTTCTISTIFDQSARANHLTSAPPGGNKSTPGNEASATSQKLTISGHPVYAVVVNAGIGYRIDKTSGVAIGDAPEGEYMVTSGTHFNGGCCFDYGNAETNNDDDGNGTMEAVYFGNSTGWGTGAGTGPWVMADLENGLYTATNFTSNPMNTPLTTAFVTAMVKGRSGGFALKGGNAQSGALKTMYDGGRPSAAGYNPMKKQGAIILGIGGDNSNSAVGTFFEGCMTSGDPPDAADDAVQANIVAAGYGR